MAPVGQAGEVYVPRSLQAWRALMNWLGFFFQTLLRILRGTPCLPHLLSSALPSPSFRPLSAVELPLSDTTSAAQNGPRVEKLTATEAGLKWFEIGCVSSEKVNYVPVFERPGLREFLKRVCEFVDLVLFTAGVEDYAKPLVDRIDVENLFKLHLYRPSTVSTECREHVKDLSCLPKDICRIVIFDNNPFSFLLQPLNGIPCVPFSARQPYDDQLLEVLLPLLKQLSLQKDVRPVLHERFHMPEWFQMHGIPAYS